MFSVLMSQAKYLSNIPDEMEMTLKKIPVVMILLSVFISACQAKGPSSQLDVELNDFTITPNQLAVPAESEIQIRITNKGVVVLNFYIMQYGVNVGDMFDEEDIASAYWEAEVQPDDTAAFNFKAPDQSGIYQIVCGMPGHLQAGMVGTLEVVR